MNPTTPDRRASPRHLAIANQARIEWLEQSEPRWSACRLVDVSRGGALLIADSPPPLYQAVWVRMDEPTWTDEVRATVIRHGESNRVGLSFPEPCPDDLHLAATLGINPCAVLLAR
jgi:hypothetical protein